MPRFRQTAVKRNRVKRRLRELARLRLLPALAAGPAADVVLRVTPPAYAAPFDALAAEVERAIRQLVPLARAGLPERRPPAPRPQRPTRSAAPAAAAVPSPAADAATPGPDTAAPDPT